MNTKEIFLVANVLQNKMDNHLKMQIEYERACTFLKETVCDFARIDADIHPTLDQKFNLPPLKPTLVLTESFQERSLGATNFPDIGVTFKRKNDETKYFIPVTTMNRMTWKQLEINKTAVNKSKHTTAEVKFEISNRKMSRLFQGNNSCSVIILKFFMLLQEFSGSNRKFLMSSLFSGLILS